jgi:hypothetical protein
MTPFIGATRPQCAICGQFVSATSVKFIEDCPRPDNEIVLSRACEWCYEFWVESDRFLPEDLPDESEENET